MTPIDWKLVHCAAANSPVQMPGRQSLVTPIDWKQPYKTNTPQIFVLTGRQSLVTPIDWKRELGAALEFGVWGCRQSLVTPIDWKLLSFSSTIILVTVVANPW